MEYQVKKPSHAIVPLNCKMDVMEDAHGFFMSSILAIPPSPTYPAREERLRCIGWCREGNTHENNNGYVVFKLNIYGSAGKQSGLEG
jgi:hypothetical protein